LQSFKPLTNTALSHLGKYQDLYVHSLDGEADGTEVKLFGDQKESMRSAVMIHAINHVLKYVLSEITLMLGPVVEL